MTSIQQAYNCIVSGMQAAITPDCLPLSYVSENSELGVIIWRADGKGGQEQTNKEKQMAHNLVQIKGPRRTQIFKFT